MQYKRVNFIVSLLIVMSMIFLLSCNSGKTSQSEGKNSILVPLKATNDKEETVLGTLSINQVEIKVPGNSFDSATQITVQNPESVPDLPSNLTALGSSIEISVNTNQWLNQAATITFRIPEKDKYLKDFRSGNIWVGYFSGTEWYFFPPDQSDPSAGTITFSTYHFSVFNVVKVPVEERIKRFSHSESLASVAQDKSDELVGNLVANAVDMILLDKLKYKDDSVKYKILSSLANDDEWGDLITLARQGDTEMFSNTLLAFAGKKIVEEIDHEVLTDLLEGITEPEMVSASIKAAGFIAEKQYAEAGRILGEEFADTFLFTKLAKAGIEVVSYNIDLWKKAEIEQAYQAYKKGASSWKYDIDPGDFNALWSQMLTGLATRMEHEAVDREITRRVDLGLPEATEDQLNAVRNQVKTDLEKMFKLRASKEAELEKEQERLEALYKIFEDSRLFESGMYGYEADLIPLDTRFGKLYNMVAKILKDTRRQNWNTSAFTNDREISANDIVSLIKAWYSTNGEKEYAALIKKKFGIDINQTAVSTPIIPTTASTTKASARPIVISFDGPDKFEFDPSFNVVGLYTFKVTVQGGTPPYYYIWKGSRAPQIMVEGTQYDTIKISPQDMRSPGSMFDGYFVWVTVKDSKNQYATWGNGSTEYTYGLKFTGKIEIVDSVQTLVENTWEKITEP